jgi:hypothetical protein
MVGPRQSRPPTRRALVILTSLLLAAASVAACGPPAPRVHLGPVPVELFSWEMGRTLAVYVGIDDATLVRGGVGWDTESAALDEPGQVVLFGHRTPSNDRGLTLVACHPPGSVQYRFVVHAELI